MKEGGRAKLTLTFGNYNPERILAWRFKLFTMVLPSQIPKKPVASVNVLVAISTRSKSWHVDSLFTITHHNGPSD
ncbi:hypothetical protein J6590_027611 [Homalodisca vitripennis]|nr:hypothetical protein J6590_027611 [Homalodisca vitripennis]